MRKMMKEMFLLVATLPGKAAILAIVAASAIFPLMGDDSAFARGTSAAGRLDLRTGTRIAVEGEAIPVAYSPRWGNAASCTVAETGRAALVAAATEDGTTIWTPHGTGGHTLTHTAGGETLTAQFAVLGDDVAVAGGRLSTSAVWGTDKVYLVTAPLTIPSGISLTIEPGAVVKFMPGTSLTLESGGSCTAHGVIFTHVNDDTIGGDVLFDGAPAVAIPTGDYTISGSITDDDSTEYRYMPPQTLTSSIPSNTRLRGYRTYIISNSVTVASGATLTLQPGTILKFNTGCSLTVNGTLDAQGTRAAPIVFTSLKDDTHGGDTNGDGEGTYAQAGDWYQISVPGTANFNYCHVLYNSSTENTGAIDARGGTVTFDNSEIAHTKYECVNAHNSGYFTARNSVFRDSSLGFGYYGSGRVKAYNCVFADLTTAIRQSGKTLTNCVFYRCLSFTDQSGDGSTYSHCVFYNPTSYGAQSYTKCGTNGNIWGDPLFADPDNGDFRIAANSPCVDAGDGSIAPELDYYGQPRMDVKRIVDTGAPNGDGVCPDIGIYEVPGAAVVPLPDLAVVSISRTGSLPVQGGNALAARSTIGDTITVTYTVTNRGAAAATGLVRDLFRFKGADASTAGLSIDAGEAEQAYNLPAGAEAAFTASVTVPPLKAGVWKIVVDSNPYRDIFEQNLSDNRAQSEETFSIELEAMANGTQSVTVAKGETAGYALSGLPLSGGVVRVTGAGAALLAAYGGNGAVPTSRTGCQPVQSGTAEPAVLPLQDGSILIVFPPRAEGENAYLVLENTASAEATVSVEVKEPELALYDAAPGRIANTGEATVTITGSGLADGVSVTLGGRTAKSVETLNAAQFSATFDVDGMAAGKYGVTAGSASLPDAVEIYAAKTGPKLKAWLEMPSSVRDGRVFTGYVCYANEGDSPMTMPVFKVAREDSNTRMGLVASESMTDTVLYVGGISPTHPAGVFKAGDEARIPFYFQPFGTYKIKLTHIKDAENLAAYPTFGGTKAYLAAMGAAATRLNLRGRTAYDVNGFLDLALWEKNDVARAAASGYLIDAKTGEPLANASISLVDADAADENNLPPATTTTDSVGYFQLANLADGEYRWLLGDGNTLADSSTNTVAISGQADLNGLAVYASPGGKISGYVLTASGAPVAYGMVVRLDESGSLVDATEADGFGAFAFSGLPDGAYAVRAMPMDGYMSATVTNIVIDAVQRSAIVAFALEQGARLGGTVTFNGVAVANGTVQAVMGDGTCVEVSCATNGTYLFDGIAPEEYSVRYYSNIAISGDEEISLAAGDSTTLDLSANERPLFMPTLPIGYGTCETEFFFTDSERAAGVAAWAWDFDSDGVVDSTDARPKHTYATPGMYTVTLAIVENGIETRSVYENCVEVREKIDTVLKAGAIVGGINSGSLGVVSATDKTLVLSGSPDAGTIEAGNVILIEGGDDVYCRRVTGVAVSGGNWVLDCDDADPLDAYEQFAFSFTAPYEIEKAQPLTTLSNSLRSMRLLAAEDDKDKDGFSLIKEGGLTVTGTITPHLTVLWVNEYVDGKHYQKRGIVGSLELGGYVAGEGAIGGKYQVSIPVPVKVKIPTSIPFLSVTGEGKLYATVQAQIKGKLGASFKVEPTVTVAWECKNDGKWKMLPAFEQPKRENPFKFEADIEGSIEVRVGFKPKIGLQWTAVKVACEADAFISDEWKASLRAPAEFNGRLGVDISGVTELVAFGKTMASWVTPTLEGPRFNIFSWKAAEPDFEWSPSHNINVGDSVHFVNKTGKETAKFVFWDMETSPAGYKWQFSNGQGIFEGKDQTVSFPEKATYRVYLQALGTLFTGPYRVGKWVVVGEKDDDGDEEPDDDKSDKGKQSCDPNEVNGPLGIGEQRYVKPGDWMDYTIYFENKEGFDIADAQEVSVTNPLDRWLDWNTFEMREVAFNNQNDNSLYGLVNATSDIKINGSDNYVRASVKCDAATGVVDWKLRVWDPDNDENFNWPSDGSGFLPSNDDTHRGEGHITYRIKVREDAPSNVVITNSATIVFDYNDPIETDPAWWNTVGSRGVGFVSPVVAAGEGETAEIRVLGGSVDEAASVKVYLTYNTAAAADVDLAKGTVDSSTGSLPVQNAQAARSTGLKFPLTLTWEKGEIGEKAIVIPVKADKTVEADEFFTLQLAEPFGMELGDGRVCTVAIHDSGYDELAAKIAAGTATKAEITAWNKLQAAKVPYIRGLADSAERGKVTGSGLCAEGKKVTLKAAANKGYVFTGWTAGQIAIDGDRLVPDQVEYMAATPSLVIDRTAKPAKNSATSTTLTGVTEDATFYACFVTAAEDAAAVSLEVGGEQLSGETEFALSWTNWCGVAVEWPIVQTGLVATTVKAAGLPSGVKLVQDKTTKAYSVKGVPSSASKIDKKTGAAVPSKTKFTVTTAGKSSKAYSVDWTIIPLPAWATGNFDGTAFSSTCSLPVPEGLVNLTVSAAGKISGKLLEGGLAWTLSAASYGSYDAETDSFLASVVGKSGKMAFTNEVVLCAGEAAQTESESRRLGIAVGLPQPFNLSTLQPFNLEWTAWQNLWKRADTKAGMPVFKKNIVVEYSFGEEGDKDNTVKFTFKKDGVVSFAGKIGGASVSGSSQIVWNGETWQATFYAPPKPSAKPPFAGWCETFSVNLATDEAGVVSDVELIAP